MSITIDQIKNYKRRVPRQYNKAGVELLQEVGYKQIPYGPRAKVHRGEHWVSPAYLHWHDEFKRVMDEASGNQETYKFMEASDNNPAFRFRNHRNGTRSAVIYNPATSKNYQKPKGPTIYLPRIVLSKGKNPIIPKKPTIVRKPAPPIPRKPRNVIAETKHIKRTRNNLKSPMP